MTSDRDVARDLVRRLRSAGDARTRAWWNGYVKGGAPFIGVRMPAIRSILHDWHDERIARTFDLEAQLDIALAMFEGRHSEEKLAGTLFLQEILIPERVLRARRDVPRMARLFDEGWIHDWNVCDWFCVKVLGPLIAAEGKRWAGPVGKWRTADNLWRARASLVAFVKVADDPEWHPSIARSSEVLIRRSERFAKTAVGWILRDVSRHDPAFTKGIVERHLAHFSVESVDNATKRLPGQDRARLRRLFREGKGTSGRRSTR